MHEDEQLGDQSCGAGRVAPQADLPGARRAGDPEGGSARSSPARLSHHGVEVARASPPPGVAPSCRAATRRRSVADQEQPVPEGDRIRRPRTRGDRPQPALPLGSPRRTPPHARGPTRRSGGVAVVSTRSPARAGMNRCRLRGCSSPNRRPPRAGTPRTRRPRRRRLLAAIGRRERPGDSRLSTYGR